MAETLRAFLDSTAGVAILGMVAVAFADFVTGVLAAARDGTFALDSIAAFLRKHIAGRVGPIAVLLALGYFGGDTIGTLFTAAALASAAAYTAETASSILGNLNPPKPSAEVAATNPAEAVNPVPED